MEEKDKYEENIINECDCSQLSRSSGCSNNSNSTNNSSAKSSKTTQKKHWDKKKDQKLAKEIYKYSKKKSQTYTKYDGKKISIG